MGNGRLVPLSPVRFRRAESAQGAGMRGPRKLLQASRLTSLGLPHRAFLASGTGTLDPLLCVEYSGKSR